LHELLQTLSKEQEDLTRAQGKRLGKAKKTAKKPLNAKARNNVLNQSKVNFALVLNHPQYQANPLATIREHMNNLDSSRTQT